MVRRRVTDDVDRPRRRGCRRVRRPGGGSVSELGASALVADRFSIDRLVERGGMGVVYRALGSSQRRAGGAEAASSQRRWPGERALRTRGAAAGRHPPPPRGALRGPRPDRRRSGRTWPCSGSRARISRTALAAGAAVPGGQPGRCWPARPRGWRRCTPRGSSTAISSRGTCFCAGGSAADLLLLDFGLARQLAARPG